MKRRLLTSLALTLVLSILLPSLALAADSVPFTASGVITGITEGTVSPAGDSGRFRVIERQIYGIVSGDISGEFVMTYKGNVELATQAGNIQGNITVGPYNLKMNGKSQPLELVWFEPFQTYLPKLSVVGQCMFTAGASGSGNLQAWAIFIPTPEGHVGFIVASAVVLTGAWQPVSGSRP